MGVYEILFKSNGKKVLKTMNAVSKKIKDLNKDSLKLSKSFDKFANKTPFGSMIPSMVKLTKSFILLRKGIGKIFSPITLGVKAFKGMKSVGQSTASSLSAGFSTMGKVMKLSFLSATKGALVFAAATVWLIAIVAVVTMIMVAVKALGLMFKMNIGGMATKWNKFMGQAKQGFAKFTVALMKGIKFLEPIISIIVDGLFKGLSIAFKGLTDAFKIVGEHFKKFGENKKQMENMKRLAKGIGTAFKLVGTILAKTFKIVAVIITGTIDAIMTLVDWIFKLIDAVKNSPLGKKLGWDKTEGKIQDSSAVSAQAGNSTTNNTMNDNKVISIMTNKEITEQGASGFSDIIGAQSFI